jgi:hypothetical protein
VTAASQSIVRARPCGECPWRRDSIPGKFPPDRYTDLAVTAGQPGLEVPIGTPFFACHMSVEGRDAVCAGWAAVCGREHLGLRLAVVVGRAHAGVFDPQPQWPDLYESYTELSDVNSAVVPAKEER